MVQRGKGDQQQQHGHRCACAGQGLPAQRLQRAARQQQHQGMQQVDGKGIVAQAAQPVLQRLKARAARHGCQEGCADKCHGG
ncbi:hypothetical protein D3C72_2002900 [compost metagenome]